jgi:hypothetical protein
LKNSLRIIRILFNKYILKILFVLFFKIFSQKNLSFWEYLTLIEDGRWKNENISEENVENILKYLILLFYEIKNLPDTLNYLKILIQKISNNNPNSREKVKYLIF